MLTQGQLTEEMAKPEKHWKAHLNLVFENRVQRTVISHYKHQGPLQIQKPFYPEGLVCHVYLLHPPGGIVGGDHLSIDISAQPNAHCLLTTPAAGKFYRSNNREASQQVNITINDHAALEWFPQETILFNACQAKTKTTIQLGNNSKFIGWELTCFGRPAAGERFSKGYYKQQFELWRNNKPLLLERTHLRGDEEAFNAHWGLNGFTVMATLIASPAHKTHLTNVRENLTTLENEVLSVTLIGDVLVCRYLGTQAEIAKQRLIEVWKIIRPSIMQRPTCIPRIWAT